MFHNHSKKIRRSANNGKNGFWPKASALFVAVASLLGVGAAQACTTYYVSTAGNDNNPGTSSAAPKLSIYQAIKNAAPCDTVYVGGGVYNQLNIYVAKSGTPGNPIRIMPDPSNTQPVIVDAAGLNPGDWDSVFNLAGQYIELSGFELRNAGMGVLVQGANSKVSNMKIHDMMQQGIMARGDYSVIEGNTVYLNSLRQRKLLASGGWACGILAYGANHQVAKHVVVRGNTAYDNYGEGINTTNVDGTLIENNIVYDNYGANTYISNSVNVIFRNNLVYNTPNNVVGRRASVFTISDEESDLLASLNNYVVDNMFRNGDLQAFSWTLVPGHGLSGTLISNNTLVNGTLKTGPINQASTIQNNIFFTDNGTVLASIPTRSGLTMNNNLWSAPPTDPDAVGKGDVVGNPKLALTGLTGPGQLTAAYFAYPATSIAMNKGASILYVNDDYLISNQSAALNIGAYPAAEPPIKYSGGLAATTIK